MTHKATSPNSDFLEAIYCMVDARMDSYSWFLFEIESRVYHPEIFPNLGGSVPLHRRECVARQGRLRPDAPQGHNYSL